MRRASGCEGMPEGPAERNPMSTWYSAELGDGIAAHAPSQAINTAYLSYALIHGEDTGAAIFSRMDLKANMVTAYFSPEAATLAAQFGGTPCAKPERTGRLGLLAGSALDWARHFPE